MVKLPKGAVLGGKPLNGAEQVLMPDAMDFLAQLARAFEAERQSLLARRKEQRKLYDAGQRPAFPQDTAAIRAGSWQVAQLPYDLQDRRYEITGPPDRKFVIKALNSGAKAFTANFGDIPSTNWPLFIQGQRNLVDRWTSAMEHTDPETGKRYALGQKLATLIVRPRGLQIDEPNLMIDGKPIAASLFDFGLYFYHNAKTAIAKAAGPYFSLPRVESHNEARLWNRVFILAQSLLGLPLGTIKATVRIDTFPSAFEMDEILFELRDHISGLGCDSRSFLLSTIETLAADKTRVLPDHQHLSVAQGFLAAHATLLVKTAHKRGCLALGDVAPRMQRMSDDEKSAALVILQRKMEAEARIGFDGTCVAQSDLVPFAQRVFAEMIPTSNQLYVTREDVEISQGDLLEVPVGPKTEASLRYNMRLGIASLVSRLGGLDAGNRDGDLATALCWQWLKHGAKLDDGPKLTRANYDRYLAEEAKQLHSETPNDADAQDQLKKAIAQFKAFTTATSLAPSAALPVKKTR